MDKSREIKARKDWHPIATAPFNREVELAVLDTAGRSHALVFPCHRVLHGWVEAKTAVPVIVRPTHWRKWNEAVSSVSARPACSAW